MNSRTCNQILIGNVLIHTTVMNGPNSLAVSASQLPPAIEPHQWRLSAFFVHFRSVGLASVPCHSGSSSVEASAVVIKGESKSWSPTQFEDELRYCAAFRRWPNGLPGPS